MLVNLGRRIDSWLGTHSPWTNVYGLARSLLAASTALTLLFNPSYIFFRPLAGAGTTPYCFSTLQKVSIFCVTPVNHLEIARFVTVALLIVVASGWRPCITGVIHWWLMLGLQITATTVDGGDQAASVLTLLLLPVALTDRRKWHWNSDMDADSGRVRTLIAKTALIAIRVQVAAIYFHAAVAKLRVTEWADGTAMYYWMSSPTFGPPRGVLHFIMPLLTSASTVALLTWGVVVVEFFLSMGLLATRPARRVLLWLGLSLHLGIMLFMGLVSFALIMCGALILYLRPYDEPFARLTKRLPTSEEDVSRMAS